MIIAAIVVLFLTAASLSPLKIRAFAEYKDEGFTALVTGVFWFIPFTIYKSQEEKKKSEQETEEKKLSMSDVKNSFDAFLEAFKKLKKGLAIHLFRLEITLGLRDAANTGIATGASWATVCNMAGILDRIFVLKKHALNVTPSFKEERFDFSFEGMFGIRVIHLLGILISLGKAVVPKATDVNI